MKVDLHPLLPASLIPNPCGYNTYAVPLAQPLQNEHFREPLGCVANKRLKVPLESTLTSDPRNSLKTIDTLTLLLATLTPSTSSNSFVYNTSEKQGGLPPWRFPQRPTAQDAARPNQWRALWNIITHFDRVAHAMMSPDAGLPFTREAPVSSAFRALAKDVDKTVDLLAAMFRGKRVAEKELPDLRQAHNRLAQSGGPLESRYALVHMEADRMTNSLNTLREQTAAWLRSS